MMVDQERRPLKETAQPREETLRFAVFFQAKKDCRFSGSFSLRVDTLTDLGRSES